MELRQLVGELREKRLHMNEQMDVGNGRKWKPFDGVNVRTLRLFGYWLLG